MQRLVLIFLAAVVVMLAGCAPTVSGTSFSFAKGQVWGLSLSKGSDGAEGFHHHFITLNEPDFRDSVTIFRASSAKMDDPQSNFEAVFAASNDGDRVIATIFLEPGSNFRTRKAIFCLVFSDRSSWMGRGLVGNTSDYERATASSAEFRKQQACILSRVK